MVGDSHGGSGSGSGEGGGGGDGNVNELAGKAWRSRRNSWLSR
ncbi:hypothetical protein TIFTF001_040469 [Ficus carica]|uniref:Uncharacterized protein n=1 Tax=Ficus carica TaxID=3494 RepID=A0AA87Z8R1_FICCA|nr:hypothetical protein TIFTF001_040469 [Ficus carica]